MEIKTDCTHCPFGEICPMAERQQRLPRDEGGRGLCLKLTEMKLLRCRNCLFCRKSKSIGGSDASVIMGLNPYKSPYQLWMEKTGQVEPPERIMQAKRPAKKQAKDSLPPK